MVKMDSQKKRPFLPKTGIGKWSVILNVIFLLVIGISIVLVKVLGVLSFDDHWWDVTVLIFIASIASFFMGIRAFTKHKDKALSVMLSILIGLASILFLLLHSLFIND